MNVLSAHWSQLLLAATALSYVVIFETQPLLNCELEIHQQSLAAKYRVPD